MAGALGSALRRWWTLARNPHAEIRFGRGVRLGRGFSLHMPGGGTFIVGAGVEFAPGYRTELGHEGRITIGDGARIGRDSIITCDTRIDIGPRAELGADTYIADGSHRYRDLTRTFLEQGYDYRDVVIGEGARIGRGCTLVNSVGAGAVVVGGSMVTREVPAGAVAAGVPARVTGQVGGGSGEEPTALSRSIDTSA